MGALLGLSVLTFLSFVQNALAAGGTGTTTPTANISISSSIDLSGTNQNVNVLSYRAETERMLAVAQSVVLASEADLNWARAAGQWAQAREIQTRINTVEIIQNQLRRDDHLLKDYEHASGHIIIEILRSLHTLRNAKMRGYFTESQRRTFEFLASLTPDDLRADAKGQPKFPVGRSYEDLIQEAMIALRRNHKSFETVIDEDGNIGPLGVENFAYAPLSENIDWKVRHMGFPDPRKQPIEPFDGGSPGDLCRFALEHGYKFVAGKKAYRIHDTALSAIEKNAKDMMEQVWDKELLPKREKMLEIWKQLKDIQASLRTTPDPTVRPPDPNAS